MALSNLAVGVTGGIGSGKTVVCKIFSVLGIPVYDADSRARWLMEHDDRLVEQIKELFGPQSYNDTELNRALIGSRVFGDPELLAKLNALVHPAVGQDFSTWVDGNQDAPYVVKEAALLFETGSFKELDSVILVDAPEDLRVERVIQRDRGRSEEQVRSIIAEQMPSEKKRKLADHIINNDGSTLILPEVVKLDQGFRKKTAIR